MVEKSRPPLVPLLALLGVQFIYGFNYAAAKVILKTFPPVLWGAVRLLIASLLMFIIARIAVPETSRRTDREFLLRTFLYGLIGLALNQAFFLLGLKYSTTTNSAILNSLIPLFTLLFAILMGSEKFSKLRGASFLLAVTGAVVIRDFSEFGISSDTFRGDVFTLLNCACLALFLTLSQGFFKKNSPLWSTAWMFLFGSLVLFTFSIGDWPLLFQAELEQGLVLAAAYNIVFATMIAYYLNTWTLTKVSPSVVAVFIYLQPVIAVLNGWINLGEPVSGRTLLAMGLIFTGVGVGALRRSK
jgi:drug/metabolite transporter (DMT)-like permease